MVKILRADFYRLFKSRAMWGAWILCAVALLIYPLVFFLIDNRGYVLQMLPTGVDLYAALGLICVFLEREFDTRSYKNFTNRSAYAKLQYICSKVVVFLVIIIVFYLVELLLFTLFGLARYYKEFGWSFFVGIELVPDENGWITGPKLFTRSSATNREMLETQALGLLFAFAVAMVVLALYTLIRNGIAVSIITVVYTAAHGDLFYELNKIIPNSQKFLCYFTVFGNFTSRSGTIYDPDRLLVPQQAIFGAVAIIVYFCLSWLLMWRREER